MFHAFPYFLICLTVFPTDAYIWNTNKEEIKKKKKEGKHLKHKRIFDCISMGPIIVAHLILLRFHCYQRGDWTFLWQLRIIKRWWNIHSFRWKIYFHQFSLDHFSGKCFVSEEIEIHFVTYVTIEVRYFASCTNNMGLKQ